MNALEKLASSVVPIGAWDGETSIYKERATKSAATLLYDLRHLPDDTKYKLLQHFHIYTGTILSPKELDQFLVSIHDVLVDIP